MRENPAADHSVDALARRVHFSPFHFHRVFRAVTGETVGVFVRRVRLERATQLMKSSPDKDLGRIAIEAGFGSASDFARTFRRHYGMAPREWSRDGPLVFGASADDETKPYDLDDLIASDDGPPVRPAVETIPARTLAFHRIRMPFLDGRLEAGYAHFREALAKRGLGEPPGKLWGMSWDDMEITPPEHIRYDFACPVPDGTVEGDGMLIRRVPELRIVSAPACGDLARVARVWDHLYHEWLPRSQYEPALLPSFERYHDWPDRLVWDDWALDCCIPLVALR